MKHPHVDYWLVDEVIECLELGGSRPAVEAELLAKAPGAYQNQGVPLYVVWDGLTEETKTAINAGFRKLDIDSGRTQ